jgi:hypothetical protein
MDRNQILKEILKDNTLCEKWNVKNVDQLTTNGPYHNKLVEVLAVIINENDNNLSEPIIYKKIKNILNIA